MLFSIIIPTYNEEKNIGKLLDQIDTYCAHYSREIIVIDCGSKDKTIFNIRENQNKIKNLRLYEIGNAEFNHGLTRNIGVKLARGKYICFISADISLENKNIFKHLLNDFLINKKVVAVFGKHIPYDDCSISHKLDIICWFDKFDRYTKHHILIQDKNKPFIPYIRDTMYLWWPLANTFTCYLKSYLLKNPFKRVDYGEDYYMGKHIIESNSIKIYDNRCLIKHSHDYTLGEYYRRLSKDFNLKYSILELKEPSNFFIKLKKIIALEISDLLKVQYLSEVTFIYIVKSIIFTKLKVELFLNHSISNAKYSTH